MSANAIVFDIENAPNLGYYYDPWKENNIVATKQPWYMLSFSWKLVGNPKVHCRALCDYPGYRKDKTNDERLVRDLHSVLSSHAIWIGHNIDRFDIRKSVSRFWKWGLQPLPPRRTVDTLKIARRFGYQDSNRLTDLAQFFGVGKKLPTQGWDTWEAAMEGDPAAWGLMKRYNKHDVVITEAIWERMAPWLPNHVSLKAADAPGCPVCKSHNVQHRGYNVAKTRRTQRMQCRNCGHWYTA